MNSSSPLKQFSNRCVAPSCLNISCSAMNGCALASGSPASSPSKRPLRSPSRSLTAAVPNNRCSPSKRSLSFPPRSSAVTVSDGFYFVEEDEKLAKYACVAVERLSEEEIRTATASYPKNGSTSVNDSDEEMDDPTTRCSNEWTPGGLYEVEEVLDIKKEKGHHLFLIKWKDWSKKYNSWESEESVKHCTDLVIDCCVRKNSSYRLVLVQKAIKIASNPEDPDIATLAKLTQFTLPKNGFVKKQKLIDMRKEVLKMSVEKAVRVFGSWTSLVEQVLERQKLAESVKTWQAYIQGASGEDSDKPLLYVENSVDLEPPPANFTYRKDLLAGPGVLFSSDPPVGCDCTDCYANRKGCCSVNNGVEFGYTAKRCLAVTKGSAIFECNKKCKCDDRCPNRVLQRGSKIPLTIFKTPDGRGWGVRTNQRIPKGTFVMEYIGQVISEKDADDRAKEYLAVGSTYLFAIGYHGSDEGYTVDAGSFGNVGRFVNHSCNPNMVSCYVWVDNLVLSMPRIAFFASRDIHVNEELTIDYNITSMGSESGHQIPCKCGEKNCKGFL